MQSAVFIEIARNSFQNVLLVGFCLNGGANAIVIGVKTFDLIFDIGIIGFELTVSVPRFPFSLTTSFGKT